MNTIRKIGAAVALALAVGFAPDAWGATPRAGVLSFNIRNAAGVGAVTAECETLAGTIPADA